MKSAPVMFCNGVPATADDLRGLAVGNYGHFTSMQVRSRAVRGLDLHLQRLRDATRELFGSELDEARLRDAMRVAVAAAGESCSLRVSVFSRDFDHRHPDRTLPVDLLVSASPAVADRLPAIRVASHEFVRPLPHIKHVGTFPLFHHRRQARAAGFDDALFVDARGRVVEGTVWNIGFWDGQGVVWPQGPALRGTTEKLLQAGLEASGIPQRTAEIGLGEATDFAAAFTANANALGLIASIDGVALGRPDQLLPLLQQALSRQPWQPI